ncbi:MAG: sulfite exporter TauE/SafE family protein [Salinivirgaceae bacterium]|nr:sulfite exporter TauE/SafE family protein [Salinivirgaceae bacterium]
MTIGTFIGLILIGIVTGALSGILGIGGGIVMIPAMVYFLGFSQQESAATSLAIMLPPISIFAVMNYWKAGMVNIKVALIMMTAFMIGSYYSSKLAIILPEHYIKKGFAILLAFTAVRMFLDNK